MRITIDLASVQDTSRVLAAAADEYDRTAAALRAGEGLGGVTGSQRYWLFSAVESVAARVRAVAAQHRETASDLLRRCECAATDTVSPVYAGIAVAGAQVALDRNGDGVNDTVAVDSDGDGFFESFVLDAEQDGIYDTVLISDLNGNLQGVGVDRDQDGRIEGFIGVTPGGPVWGSDTDRNGTFEFAAIAPPATPQSGATFAPPIVGGGFGTGFSSYGTAADASPFGDGGGYFTGTGSSSYGTTAGTTAGTTPLGDGARFAPVEMAMGYIPSPTLSGMVASNVLGAGGTGSPFLNPSTSSRDYGKLPSYQQFSNSPKIDSDGDGVFNRWDNEIRDQGRG